MIWRVLHNACYRFWHDHPCNTTRKRLPTWSVSHGILILVIIGSKQLLNGCRTLQRGAAVGTEPQLRGLPRRYVSVIVRHKLSNIEVDSFDAAAKRWTA